MAHATMKASELKVGDSIDTGTERRIVEIQTSRTATNDGIRAMVHVRTVGMLSFDHYRADETVFARLTEGK